MGLRPDQQMAELNRLIAQAMKSIKTP